MGEEWIKTPVGSVAHGPDCFGTGNTVLRMPQPMVDSLASKIGEPSSMVLHAAVM